MAYSAHVWGQIKSITANELCSALTNDGWSCDMKGGSARVFLKGARRVSIHVHPGKTYGPGMLKALLANIGWSETDLRRLGLVR